MNAQRAKRLVAASAAGLLLAAGGALATTGTASATTAQVPTNRGCGWWGNCGYGYGPGYGFNNGFGPGYGYNNGGVVVIVVPG
ncbi:hypothetical protein ACIQ7S_02045 [Streptomyces griseoluteus]|uniref:hypothetical protein n=1 Tax=Streptomyces TaxID=1883 RepID=UPI00102897EA|nr:hypothetical protein [Streptomyces sp. BK022]RZU37810.1 hypothetical protein EV284_2994 [Streptomyces sp. BK022]